MNIQTTHLLVEWWWEWEEERRVRPGYWKDGIAAKTDGEECRWNRFIGEDQQFGCRHVKFGISLISIRQLALWPLSTNISESQILCSYNGDHSLHIYGTGDWDQDSHGGVCHESKVSCRGESLLCIISRNTRDQIYFQLTGFPETHFSLSGLRFLISKMKADMINFSGLPWH